MMVLGLSLGLNLRGSRSGRCRLCRRVPIRLPMTDQSDSSITLKDDIYCTGNGIGEG